MATYTFNLSSSKEFPSVDIPAGTATTFSIVNPSNNDSYFTLETARNSKGYYDENSPKNTSGSFTLDSNTSQQIQSDYIASFIVKPGTSEILFDPAIYISGSSLNIRGNGGNTKYYQFVSTWDTTLPGTSDSQSITLPLKSGLEYDMTINWGDGTSTDVSSSTQADLTHTYPSTGSYTVYITGKFDGWRFINAGDKDKITSIESWGNYELNNLTAQFQGCTNLVINAADGPLFRSGSRPHAMFSNSTNTTGSMKFTQIGNWTEGSIVSKNRAYSGNIDWSAMFYDSNNFRSGKFNQYIGDWKMHNAKDLRVFFGNQVEYNQPMNDWDVSNVNDFEYVFFAAKKFNQPLDKWKLNSATRIRLMFYLATSFNQDIGSWDVSGITGGAFAGLYGLFYQAYNFNNGGSDSIKNWDVSNNDNFSFTFGVSAFNQDIGDWDVSSGTDFSGMFGYPASEESYGADIVKFDQNIGSWNMSSATNIATMFQRLHTFNNGGSDSIRNWNTSNVTTINGIFQTCSLFNQPLDGWDTSKVTDFSRSFCGATSFDQDLSSWNVETAQTMSHMFAGVTLSTSNYDALLVSWASQSLSSSIVFDGGNSKYTGTPGSEPSESRAKMINVYNWTITDGGEA